MYLTHPEIEPKTDLISSQLRRGRFVRRGRAARKKADLDDPEASDYEEVASDVENIDELREWLSLQSFSNRGLVPHEKLVRKFLPPGTVHDLYEHYRATQSMLGCHCVSHFEWFQKIPYYFFVYGLFSKVAMAIHHSWKAILRYGTFNFIYKKRWQDVLQFRQKSLFTQCEVCWTLKSELSNKTISMEHKLGSLKLYRQHLHEQFFDR